MDFHTGLTIVMSILYFSSELLGSMPSVKSNAVYQLVFNVLKDLLGK